MIHYHVLVYEKVYGFLFIDRYIKIENKQEVENTLMLCKLNGSEVDIEDCSDDDCFLI